MNQLLRETMRGYRGAFNTILVGVVLMGLGMACQTTKKKPASLIRLHLETNADGTERNTSVPIGQNKAFNVQVETKPFVDEGYVQKATVVDDVGGFQIALQLDRKGTWLLDQYTTSNKGRRVAIYSTFGKERWLAAPIITQRIADGKFVFAPDCTREEADRIVLGLNKVANKLDDDRK